MHNVVIKMTSDYKTQLYNFIDIMDLYGDASLRGECKLKSIGKMSSFEIVQQLSKYRKLKVQDKAVERTILVLEHYKHARCAYELMEEHGVCQFIAYCEKHLNCLPGKCGDELRQFMHRLKKPAKNSIPVYQHPKIDKLAEILKTSFKEKMVTGEVPKIVILTDRSDSLSVIEKLIRKWTPPMRPAVFNPKGVDECSPRSMIDQFANGKINIIIGTSHLEAGYIDGNADVVISMNCGSLTPINRVQRLRMTTKKDRPQLFYFAMESHESDCLKKSHKAQLDLTSSKQAKKSKVVRALDFCILKKNQHATNSAQSSVNRPSTAATKSSIRTQLRIDKNPPAAIDLVSHPESKELKPTIGCLDPPVKRKKSSTLKNQIPRSPIVRRDSSKPSPPTSTASPYKWPKGWEESAAVEPKSVSSRRSLSLKSYTSTSTTLRQNSPNQSYTIKRKSSPTSYSRVNEHDKKCKRDSEHSDKGTKRDEARGKNRKNGSSSSSGMSGKRERKGEE